MKKIKSSFIGKAFFSLILLYLVVFLFLFVFQSIVFRTYYTREKIKDLKEETSSFIHKSSYENKQVEELLFSRNTNTLTSIIPLSDIENDFDNLNLYVLDVETDNGTLKLYAPNAEDTEYQINSNVSATSYILINEIYVPSYLVVDDETLLRRNTTEDKNANLLELTTENEDIIQVEGIITSIAHNESDEINSLVSNEILNITSGNYISLVHFDEGSYYFSNQTFTENSSLVFYSIVEFDSSDHLLISVYPMDYIDQIVIAAGRANMYMFVAVLLILILSAFVYSREFSRPLLFINNKTKELSKLDFTSPIIKIDSTDEFSELAHNINTLSANLQTTLYQLNEQNKQLSDTIAKENVIENTRRDFIQGMSHELKTPLAVIQASAEAIMNNIYETSEEKRDALSLIQNEVNKTKNMINSMINVYKLDSPDYQTQWNTESITQIVKDIDKSLSPLYINSELDVELDLDETYLKCDRERLETIITNLITNAIKYTPAKERIKITLRDYPTEIRFKIENFGVSIDKELLSNIFDPFYRIDKSRSRQDGSTGLGLYIVNQSLEQYNSKCVVESDAYSVTFSFTIKKSF